MNRLNLISKVITGAQTGADQGALRAAKAAGVPTGGWAAKGWDTELGPDPSLASFGLVECPEPGYRARTLANLGECDALIWFGNPQSPGGKLTIGAAVKMCKPMFLILGTSNPRGVATWLVDVAMPTPDADWGGLTLMVAGNRESGSQGIGYLTQRFMEEVFRILKDGETNEPDAAGAGQQPTEAVRWGGERAAGHEEGRSD